MSHCCNHGAGDRRAQTVTGLLERPRYSPGLILEDADLTAAVEYSRELNRLLFRSLFGCGVICGLTASVKEECGLQVTIQPGLALDGCGDPIQLAKPVTITLQKGDGVIVDPGLEGPRVKNFWIVLCGKEKFCAPRSIVCDAEDVDEAAQMTRIRSLAEVSIAFQQPECACACETPAGKLKESDYNDLAELFLPHTAGELETSGPPDCHRTHREAVDCPPGCGCGGACGCGCCVLLAWVHWYPGGGWGVLHQHVRRFIRPKLQSDDPAHNERPGAKELETTEATS